MSVIFQAFHFIDVKHLVSGRPLSQDPIFYVFEYLSLINAKHVVTKRREIKVPQIGVC